MQELVLVVGYRPQIAKRLRQLGLSFVIWSDVPLKKRVVPGCVRIIDATPFETHIPAIKQQISELFGSDARFANVIAGTESSVVAASVARRMLGGRISKHTVILRCHNKRMMKEYLRDKGIPLIPFVYSGEKYKGRVLTAERVIKQLGLPVVVKQLAASGGRGMVLAETAEALEPFLKQKVLFEQFVDAPEVSVESFVRNRRACFVNVTQYLEKTWVNLVPSGHTKKRNGQVIELHKQVLEALNIEWGLTHAEYYLAEDRIYFGEVAVRPPGGYIMDLISLAYEFNAWNAFVDNELGLETNFNHKAKKWAAAVLFHPGGGTLESVSGAEALKANPRLRKLHFYTRPGSQLEPRVGVSHAAAYALFCGDTKAETIRSVRDAKRQLVFHMADTC